MRRLLSANQATSPLCIQSFCCDVNNAPAPSPATAVSPELGRDSRPVSSPLHSPDTTAEAPNPDIYSPELAPSLGPRSEADSPMSSPAESPQMDANWAPSPAPALSPAEEAPSVGAPVSVQGPTAAPMPSLSEPPSWVVSLGDGSHTSSPASSSPSPGIPSFPTPRTVAHPTGQSTSRTVAVAAGTVAGVVLSLVLIVSWWLHRRHHKKAGHDLLGSLERGPGSVQPFDGGVREVERLW